MSVEPTARRWVQVAAYGVLTFVVLWNAWVCDDAYITFRVADNALSGHGLRWNVSERVQAFSNPLWLLIFIPIYAAIGHAYATAIMLGVLCTVTALLLARRIAATPLLLVLGVALCTLSKAFVDYATSGLENPMAWLLLAAIAIALCRQQTAERPAPRACLVISALCALLVVNRLDAGLFAAPVFIYLLWRRPGRRGLAAIFLGTLPLLIWLGFATLYYGFPFPNTAYSKLHNGWEGTALAAQGFTYLFDSLAQDPITLATITVGTGSALLQRSPVRLVFAIGVLLHLAYVVKIGGDFMSGRFLAVAFFASVLLIITAPTDAWPRNRIVAGALVLLGAFNLDGTLPNRPFWRGDMTTPEAIAIYVTPNTHGICDERAFYFSTCGLARWSRLDRLPDHSYRERGERFRENAGSRAGVVRGNIGFFGFFAGPAADIVDPVGLSDAFVARLPPRAPSQRIGHIVRDVPRDYLESRSFGSNRVTDPAMRELFERITLITRAPLFAPGRLGLILAMNLP